METRGEPELAFVLVEPDLRRIGLRFSLVPLDVVGLAKNDINSAPVGLPAWSQPLPTKKMIGILDAAVVLGPKLVLGRGKRRVAVLPKCVDEKVPFSARGQLEENLSLQRRDDVDHFFVQSLLIEGGEFLLRGLGDGGARGDHKAGKAEKDFCFEYRFTHSLIRPGTQL